MRDRPLVNWHEPPCPDFFQFAVVARVRNCDKMDRMSVIQTLASVVGPGHRVDLDNPEITIIAEICQVKRKAGIENEPLDDI